MSNLIGKLAPDFFASVVLPSGIIKDKMQFSKMRNNKYSLLFFYPLDFTFVCPSELISLNKRYDIFSSLNINVFVISIDSQFTHNAWRNTKISNGGIGKIKYPMISDINHNIIKDYGVKHSEIEIALRATFIIDKTGIIKHQSINDLPIGRNIDEIIRIFKALQFNEKYGDVCPAGWNENKDGIEPSKEGIVKYLSNNLENL